MAHPHPTLLGGVACVGVACILQIVGVATSFWIAGVVEIESKVVEGHYGLWEVCSSVSGCNSITSVTAWLKACRAFGIMAILLLALAAAGAATAAAKPDLEILSWLPYVIAALGGLCSVTTFAVFIAETVDGTHDGFHFGYSFGLCCAAAGMTFIGVGLLIASRRRRDYSRF